MNKMKNFLLAFLLLLSVSSAHAANTPEQVVNEMLSQMKAAGNFAPVVEFIHWPTAYKQMIEGRPNSVFVASSPVELKEVVRKFVTQPGELVKEKFGPAMAALPAEQRAALDTMLAQQLAKVDAQKKAREAELVKATFRIKKSEVTGGKAKVEVEQTMDGKIDFWSLNLQQIDGSWYLPVFDPSMINAAEITPPGAPAAQ